MAKEPSTPPTPPAPAGSNPPEGYKILYQGGPLPPFYVAEMLRPYLGKTVWVKDAGGRTRHGMLKEVPRVKEDQREDTVPAVTFEDEKPLYLRQIVCIALYVPQMKKL